MNPLKGYELQPSIFLKMYWRTPRMKTSIKVAGRRIRTCRIRVPPFTTEPTPSVFRTAFMKVLHNTCRKFIISIHCEYCDELCRELYFLETLITLLKIVSLWKNNFYIFSLVMRRKAVSPASPSKGCLPSFLPKFAHERPLIFLVVHAFGYGLAVTGLGYRYDKIKHIASLIFQDGQVRRSIKFESSVHKSKLKGLKDLQISFIKK